MKIVIGIGRGHSLVVEDMIDAKSVLVQLAITDNHGKVLEDGVCKAEDIKRLAKGLK